MNSAKHYVNANFMQRESAKNVIEEFSNELSMVRGKCIDIGSGPGDVTKEFLLPRLQPDVVVVGKRMRIYHELVGVSFFVFFIFCILQAPTYLNT